MTHYSPSPIIRFFTNLIILRSNDNKIKSQIIPLFIIYLLPFKNHEECLESLNFNIDDFYINSHPGIADYFIKFNNLFLVKLKIHENEEEAIKKRLKAAKEAKDAAKKTKDDAARLSQQALIKNDELPEGNPELNRVFSSIITNPKETPPLEGVRKFKKWRDSLQIVGEGTKSSFDAPNDQKQDENIEEREFVVVSKKHKDLHDYIISEDEDEDPPQDLINSIIKYFKEVENIITQDIVLLFKLYIFNICEDCKNAKNKDEYFRFAKFWVVSSLISQL